jgi:hypothetical protein
MSEERVQQKLESCCPCADEVLLGLANVKTECETEF